MNQHFPLAVNKLVISEPLLSPRTVVRDEFSVIYDDEMLQTELKSGELLAEKGADKQLYLYKSSILTPVLLEIGRLRELSFRTMGLGSGKTYDLDVYDYCYEHLILWDDQRKIIVGAYRLKACDPAITRQPTDDVPALYSQNIFHYSESFTRDYAPQTVEMGRIFVRPSFHGSHSLNYLWFGMAHYFARHPHLDHFICALSMPSFFDEQARAVMVTFFSEWFADDEQLAIAQYPYRPTALPADFSDKLAGVKSRDQAFQRLHKYMADKGLKVPMLFKNTAIFSDGSARFIDFGYDKGFGNAFDGLFLANIDGIRPDVLKRYLI